MHIVVRKRKEGLAICFRGIIPFIGPLKEAEELKDILSKENAGQVYEVLPVGEQNANPKRERLSKGKKRSKAGTQDKLL